MAPRQALKAAPPAKRGCGHNGSAPKYTTALAMEVCERLAMGEPLNVICRDRHMPTEAAVRQWVRDDRGANEESGAQGFASMYTRARDLGYDSIAESLLTITDGDLRGPDGYIDNGEIQRLRLLSDNRRWMLAKMRPRQYGDKVTQEITGSDGSQLVTRIELIPVEPRRLNGPEIEQDAPPMLPQDRKPGKSG